MWFWTFAAMGFAGILDLAVGTLLVHLLAEYFSYPLVWWQYAIGAFLGAAPDIDLFWGFFRKNMNGHHEYLTHRPVIGLALAASLGWFFGGMFWSLAAFLGVYWHYLHDTEGFLGLSGGGIAWFWPFSKKYVGTRGLHLHVISWVSHGVECNKGNDCTEMHDIYLVPTRRSLTEFALTGLCFGYVIGDLFGMLLGVSAALLFWAVIGAVWGEWLRRRLMPVSKQ